MIAVLSAFEEEIAAIKSAIEVSERRTHTDKEYVVGTIDGHGIVAGPTGMGKSMAAAGTQFVIDTYAPHTLVYLGIGGCLETEIDIGDVVVADDCVQHDVDVTRFGFKRGEIPDEGVIEIPSDQKLAAAVKTWKGRKVHPGRILTGDRFVGDATEAQNLRDELSGAAVDMEGASAGLIAYKNNVRFLLAQVISDKADGKVPPKFNKFLDESSQALLDLLLHLFSQKALP